MNLPDRSKWPEGATHWSPAVRDEGRLEAYWMPDGAGLYNCWAISDQQSYWQKNRAVLPSYAIELVQPWNGEGLPPVGTVCEYKHVSEWQKVEVFAVKPNHNGSHTALFTYENGTWCGCAEPSFFRPIRTPEQVARDKSTAAWIEQIEKEYGWDTAAECERILIEGGYRKQVAP